MSKWPNLGGMFGGAASFDQDLSSWCVAKVLSEPDGFAVGSPLQPEHMPIWGTCPGSDPEPEPDAWDIKYLVNGTWIYESTGPIVESNADRNTMCRNAATALVIADSVTELGYAAFADWKMLNSVEFGQTVEIIGNVCFARCLAMKKFIFPNSLASLGQAALDTCQNVNLIEFGTGLTTIGGSALSNCHSLQTAVFKARVMPAIGDYAFGNGGNGDPEPVFVYVPDDLFDEYENAIWNLARRSAFLPLSTYIQS